MQLKGHLVVKQKQNTGIFKPLLPKADNPKGYYSYGWFCRGKVVFELVLYAVSK